MKNVTIPEGYQTVMPYLILENAEIFLKFSKNVFSATEKMKHLNNEGAIMHAEIQIGGSTIMFTNSTEKYSTQTAGLYIYVENADETYLKALTEGATSVMEPSDQEYGRSGGIVDPCGNTWWIVSVLK